MICVNARAAMNSAPAAVSYIRRGWQPVPVPPGSKAPGFKNWENFTCEAEEIGKYFVNGCNIGLLLGTPSAGLVDVDIDSPEALPIAPYLLPLTQMVSG